MNKTLVKYHPDTRFLIDYTAGSLSESQALCVAAHLHFCPACRMRISELTQLGAELFLEQPPADVSTDCFEQVLTKLDTRGSVQQAEKPAPSVSASKDSTGKSGLPRAIEKMTNGNIENLNWRSLGKTFRYSNIRTADTRHESSLLEIKAGGKIPKHHHGGDEITVVLKGSFSDQEDHYHAGDYIVRTRGETHTPVASQDEDCLCLTTLDSPIVMNNWTYRLLMPFFNKPASAG